MEILWKRNSPINEEIIKSVEQTYCFNLPDDFKQVVIYANNGRPSSNTFDSPRAKEHIFKKLLSFRIEDKESVFVFKDFLNKVYPDLFPIADDPAGNLICYKDNKIVYWLHETNEIEYLAESFTAFLNILY